MAFTRIFSVAAVVTIGIAALGFASSDMGVANEARPPVHQTRDYAPLVFFEPFAYVPRFPPLLVAPPARVAVVTVKHAGDEDLAAAEAKRQRNRRRHDLGVTC